MDAKTRLLLADPNGIQAAVTLLRAGGLVAFPTETVYGLGADARQDKAVAGIFAAKGRPDNNPLIIHVADAKAAGHLVALTPKAIALTAKLWPGPLTLVAKALPGKGLSPLCQAGLSTLAIRVPAAAQGRSLLRAFGGPLAAPSANPSGSVSPTTAAHVMAGLDGKINAVLDGGPCPVGVESTIVDCTGEPTILRHGGISAEDLATCLGAPLPEATAQAGTKQPNAPGQLASHYAPRAGLRLNADNAAAGEAFLTFGQMQGTLNLSPSGNLEEAAANLFAHLIALDEGGAAQIAVSPIPDRGLGRAINDRLQRAAAPRPTAQQSAK